MARRDLSVGRPISPREKSSLTLISWFDALPAELDMVTNLLP
jgi:hypothetical protein